jgi:hypothetical protein
MMTPQYYKKIDNIDFEPIFLLGGNRSGTSLLSSIISQNSEVEGIFEENNKPHIADNKHVLAYCTSHHIWDFLLKMEKNWHDTNEGVLWGHPKHISKYYLDKIFNKKKELLIANSIQNYRKTNKKPFINSHFNMFRIGMIKNIFPRAKFILIIKNHNEIIESCFDKWTKQNIQIDYPKIGIHWYNLNAICIYDLFKYAKKDHCIIDYSELFDTNEKTNSLLNNKLNMIGLSKFNYVLDEINPKYRFSKKNNKLDYKKYFGWVEKVILDEKNITKKLSIKDKVLEDLS